ncbi:hypothetical protein, partial [Kribbella sp. NPDC049227]|uniref:hypothetical protein n=1 Tax=Kribbella sp. NPDC049227 TaxID=3364113 RepID=UPI00371E2031
VSAECADRVAFVVCAAALRSPRAGAPPPAPPFGAFASLGPLGLLAAGQLPAVVARRSNGSRRWLLAALTVPGEGWPPR